MRPLLALLLLVTTWASGAPTREQRECVEASETAQRLTDELHFAEAKKKLLRCADSRCPAVVQADCAGWLTQLQSDQPSIVIATRVGEKDYLELPQVEVDGVVMPLLRLGQPLELDPGPHQVAVKLQDGRVKSEAVVVGVGEKNRRLMFEFSLPPLAPPPPPSAVVSLVEPPRAPPVLPLVFSGGAVLAGVTFAVLASLGRTALGSVEALDCAALRSCDPALLGPTRSLYAGADVAAVTGLVLAGVAVWQWIVWGKAAPSAALAPAPGPAPLTFTF